MKAEIHQIPYRSRSNPVEVSHPGQFRLESPVAAEAEVVLGDGWSLYCLDIQNKRALFVELPPATDLGEAPFTYTAQFEGARRAATVPLEALPDLASQVPEVENLAILMSTGRCGSTLASRIFAQIPGVWSVSEPDWFTNLAFGRFGLDPTLRDTLIDACVRLTCRPPGSLSANSIILKPRSEMMIQAAAYVDVLNGANAVFLYRDCYGYVNSLYRFAQRVQGVKDPAPGSPQWEFGRQMCTINAPETFLEDFFEEDEEVHLFELLTLAWVLRMGAFLQASSDGMRVTPIHYEDLTSDRSGQTSLLLSSCGIDSTHLQVALRGFDKDAHSGSAGENAVAAEPISAAQRDRVGRLVERWGMSDYVSDRLQPLGR